MKGFVIIDVPERCDKCCLRHMGMAYCNVAGRSTSHTNAGKPLDETVRPKFCPIIEEKEKVIIQGHDLFYQRASRRTSAQPKLDLMLMKSHKTHTMMSRGTSFWGK